MSKFIVLTNHNEPQNEMLLNVAHVAVISDPGEWRLIEMADGATIEVSDSIDDILKRLVEVNCV